MGHLNGLAPTNQGGPFDRCVIDGSWSPEHQAAHGGPIPFTTGAPASRGIAETWPYEARWKNIGHSRWERSDAVGKREGLEQQEAPTDWAKMNWNQGGNVEDDPVKQQQSRGLNEDGSKRQRGKNKIPNRKRGGIKKHRCNADKEKRDNGTINFFFGNHFRQ